MSPSAFFSAWTGSSPLTRGKRVCLPPVLRRAGLIPAHAGKTRGTGASRRGAGAHPRSRGENLRAGLDPGGEPGSSPLTRGKRKNSTRRSCSSGLIPAHAGKTGERSERGREIRAHPRSRGENGASPYSMSSPQGSSPLTRGKRGYRRVRRNPKGLIPAHAGKTGTGQLRDHPPGAHPRSRGENEERMNEQ